LYSACLLAWFWPQAAGFRYDAILHALFVGFAFSMVFGHVPVIFPAVLGLPIRFGPASYAPVIVLLSSLPHVIFLNSCHFCRNALA
jgi:hypothetical protein